MTAILMRNLLGSVLIVGILYGAYYFIDRNGYQRCKTEQANADKAEAVRQANKIKEAAERHDHDQATINNLAGELDKRMRERITICPTTPQGNQDGASGVAASRVDEAYYRLRDRGSELIKRCADLNAAAIEANFSAP